MHFQELNDGEDFNGHPLANVFVQCQQYVSKCVCNMKPEWFFPLPCSLSVRRSSLLLGNFLTSLALPLEISALKSYLEFCCWCIKYGAYLTCYLFSRLSIRPRFVSWRRNVRRGTNSTKKCSSLCRSCRRRGERFFSLKIQFEINSSTLIFEKWLAEKRWWWM